MTEHNPRTYFFRPSRTSEAEPVLNPVLIAQNASHGVETTLILDTNVLIKMEQVVKGGNKRSLVKENGLHNLVDLLGRCPPGSVFLSPGRAFDEMPPALAELSRQCFDIFCAVHLPAFVDTPDCIRKTYVGKGADYGYLDLEPSAQAFLAVPYAALLYLNIIDKSVLGKPIAKFQEFLQRLSDDIDVLSSKEIEIAKYCFADPPATARETIRLRKVLRANFLKTKKDKAVYTYEEATTVAFNGACDLALINFANVMQTRGLGGKRQDCWIATRDKKLFEFSKVFHYLSAYGQSGLFAMSSPLVEHEDDHYWREANRAQRDLGQRRMPHHLGKEIQAHTLPEVVVAAMNEAARVFDGP